MTVKLLESGYWHVRWSMNQFIQWPMWAWPRLADAFGWVTKEMVYEAQYLVDREGEAIIEERYK